MIRSRCGRASTAATRRCRPRKLARAVAAGGGIRTGAAGPAQQTLTRNATCGVSSHHARSARPGGERRQGRRIGDSRARETGHGAVQPHQPGTPGSRARATT
jgi:hypothetical protein